MRTPPRPLLLAVTLPFAAGCFSIQPAPLPAPDERERTEIRGVVVGGEDDGGREVRFNEVYDVDWGPTELEINGWLDEEGAAPGVVTRRFAYQDLSGVLTKQLDANRSSFLIAGAAFAVVASVVFFFTERTGGAGTGVLPDG